MPSRWVHQSSDYFNELGSSWCQHYHIPAASAVGSQVEILSLKPTIYSIKEVWRIITNVSLPHLLQLWSRQCSSRCVVWAMWPCNHLKRDQSVPSASWNVIDRLDIAGWTATIWLALTSCELTLPFLSCATSWCPKMQSSNSSNTR